MVDVRPVTSVPCRVAVAIARSSLGVSDRTATILTADHLSFKDVFVLGDTARVPWLSMVCEFLKDVILLPPNTGPTASWPAVTQIEFL